jgi:hypothetical protein
MYLTPYFIVGAISLFGTFASIDDAISKKERISLFAFSIFFAILVLLANYSIFLEGVIFNKVISFLLLILTGIPVFYKALLISYLKFASVATNNAKSTESKVKDWLYFLIPFGIILSVDLIYLFCVAYPGNLTPDTIDQMTQIHTGVYSNHHPFYHTMLIKIFYSLGYGIFGNSNDAIATYCVFQIIAMSAIFAFAVYTLHQAKAKNVVIAIVVAAYAFLPYNYMYASTVWKDILFGGFCLLLITALYRLRKNIGQKILNTVLFAISTVGVCLLRSNGLFAAVILFIVLMVAFYKSNQLIPIISISAILVSVVLKGPVLSALNVTSPDTVESLSIPLQQIARTVRDGGELTDEEAAYVDSILDIEAIPGAYSDYISDPIKYLGRINGANEAINENKMLFLKTWLSIGIKNIDKYIYAWVDQTKGFWNAGYAYSVCAEGIFTNEFGICKEIESGTMLTISREFSNMFFWSREFSILTSIGFLAWIYFAIFVFSIMKKRTAIIECILTLGILLSLYIATPVFCEFRYSYSIYTMFPLVFVLSLIDKSEFEFPRKKEKE